jgi:hypothetical protein
VQILEEPLNLAPSAGIRHSALHFLSSPEPLILGAAVGEQRSQASFRSWLCASIGMSLCKRRTASGWCNACDLTEGWLHNVRQHLRVWLVSKLGRRTATMNGLRPLDIL